MSRLMSWVLVCGCLLATNAIANSTGVEAQRQEFCKLLLYGTRCEPTKKVFGLPPQDSIVDLREVELCKNNVDVCTPVKLKLPPTPETMPKGNYIRVLQKLSTTARNGTKKEWNDASVIYYWEDATDSIAIAEKSTRYDVEYNQVHSFFWVQGSFYETSSDEWLSYETGKSYKFYGHPLVSPDGNHVLAQETESYTYDGVFAGTNQDLSNRLYRVTSNTITEIANFSVVGNYVWVTSNEMAVFARRAFSDQDDSVIARIQLQQGEWTVKPECPSSPRAGGLIQGTNVNMRENPSQSAKALRVIHHNATRVKVLERRNDCLLVNGNPGRWIKVEVQDSLLPKEGWIFDSFIYYY